MNNLKRSSSPKTDALHAIGIRTRKQQREMGGRFDLVEVGAGSTILRAGSLVTSVVVGVTGAALVSDAQGRVTQLQAPFIFDSWVAGANRLASYSAVTETDTTLLVMDVRYRHLVFGALPQLRSCSVQSELAIQIAQEKFIDLTTSKPPSKPTKYIHFV